MSAAAVAVTALCSEWTPVQLAKFLDYVTAHRLGGCFALTLLGLRREEVGGLCWSDIELDTGALHIRRARVDVNGRDTIVPTKTERSARGLPVPPRELAMLRAMRSVHLRERLAVGRPLSDADLLLSRVDGNVATGARLLARVCAPTHRRRVRGDHAQQAAAQQHLTDVRGGHRRRCGCRLARPYRAHDPGRLRAGYRRPPDRSRGRLLL